MDSISYRIDSDQRPLSTLVVLYPVEQFEDGLLVYTDSKPCLRVPNESDPGSIYIESDSVGEDDQRYIPEDWLSPDMCQAITNSLLQLCHMTLLWPNSPPLAYKGDIHIAIAKHEAPSDPDSSVRHVYKAIAVYTEENTARIVRQDGWATGWQALEALAKDINHKIHILAVDPSHFMTKARSFLEFPISHTLEAYEAAGTPFILPQPSDPTQYSAGGPPAFDQGQSWHPNGVLPPSQIMWMIQS